MAQHYPLVKKKEPRLYKSVQRIVSYCTKPWNLATLERLRDGRKSGMTGHMVYSKYVELLGSEHNPMGLAFAIKPFRLQDQSWNQMTISGGFDWRKDACVEVHTGMKGKIQNIYYPL